MYSIHLSGEIKSFSNNVIGNSELTTRDGALVSTATVYVKTTLVEVLLFSTRLCEADAGAIPLVEGECFTGTNPLILVMHGRDQGTNKTRTVTRWRGPTGHTGKLFTKGQAKGAHVAVVVFYIDRQRRQHSL